MREVYVWRFTTVLMGGFVCGADVRISTSAKVRRLTGARG